ncbi:putative phosphotransferase [Streptomyces sp. NBRC 13847]|uniref:aminoglycoside 3'-phosphotransferase n=1 Tax=Streptomyces TaxID=1883 RepID=UPI0024A087F7|nr:aminoglycoside 3'-phosphotransferase [Streptomyces sp. NBRC 13847]GLW16831.1 putative phosphotransferase [Streptomyces sp. NBRC 13847]
MRSLSGPPGREVRVPPSIAAVAGGRPLVPVWQNALGGLTFQVGTGGGRLFAKWAPAGSGLDLAAEMTRLDWAGRFTPVPRVLDHGHDADGAWLVTRGLPGESAVSPRWTADPGTAVRALGVGLRALHERLPVADCPFSWSVAARLGRARSAGSGAPATLEEPVVDRLVVCHGDPCAPNTLLHADGSWSGHVDMGALGVADRWADLAVATWSTEWNYGPGWDGTLLDAYGIAPDAERTAFYRRLWDLT